MNKDVNSRSRNWLLTINAHEQDGLPTISMDQIKDSISDLDDNADYVFQLERGGKTDYLHFQVAVLCSRDVKPRRQDVLRCFKNHGIADAHAEQAIKTAIDIAGYCSKSRTRMGETVWSSESFMTQMMASFHRGKGASRQGSRDDISAVKDALDGGMTPDDLMLDPDFSLLMTGQVASYADRYFSLLMTRRYSTVLRDVTVHYIFGATGTGKTHYVYDSYGFDKVYRANMTARDPFANYRFQSVLVLDEFRSSVPFGQLLEMLDQYPYELDKRYRNSWAAWSDVYLLTTLPLSNQYPNVVGSEREQFYRRISDVSMMSDRSLTTLGSGSDLWNGSMEKAA
ncbi:MAG: hypothetical protein ABF792_01545 [Bifidobacterium psychraerophilum]|uniref:hypothetical protein n=1 Tax=Bifidobacterium psychraerophilum TaxID=218140 RepID=UPI0039E85F09